MRGELRKRGLYFGDDRSARCCARISTLPIMVVFAAGNRDSAAGVRDCTRRLYARCQTARTAFPRTYEEQLFSLDINSVVPGRVRA